MLSSKTFLETRIQWLLYVNFPFLNGDVPSSTSYGVYISQLIRFIRASSHVTDLKTRNKLLT